MQSSSFDDLFTIYCSRHSGACTGIKECPALERKKTTRKVWNPMTSKAIPFSLAPIVPAGSHAIAFPQEATSNYPFPPMFDSCTEAKWWNSGVVQKTRNFREFFRLASKQIGKGKRSYEKMLFSPLSMICERIATLDLLPEKRRKLSE